jgi:hypothetical protein
MQRRRTWNCSKVLGGIQDLKALSALDRFGPAKIINRKKRSGVPAR